MEFSPTVRAATDDEEPESQRVCDMAFAPLRSIYHPSAEARALRAAMTSTLERLVAVDGKQIVGTVGLRVDDDRIRVIALAVLPDVQRRGVARAMIDRLRAVARDRGCRVLAISTVAETGNVRIFERLGFRVVTSQPDAFSVSPVGQPLTETLMELEVG